VLWNLADNASKYSPVGSPIDISVTRSSRDSVQLEVRDRGVGIAPDQLPHVFERFYQASGTRRLTQSVGLGLGLSISQQIVHLHGGSITVECPTDGGTRVVVNLPGAEPEP
jgi:two-component system sensor histidine kinase MprB